MSAPTPTSIWRVGTPSRRPWVHQSQRSGYGFRVPCPECLSCAESLSSPPSLWLPPGISACALPPLPLIPSMASAEGHPVIPGKRLANCRLTGRVGWRGSPEEVQPLHLGFPSSALVPEWHHLYPHFIWSRLCREPFWRPRTEQSGWEQRLPSLLPTPDDGSVFPPLTILKLWQSGAVSSYYPDLSGKGSLETAFGCLFLPKAHSSQSHRLTLQTVTLLISMLFDLILFFGAPCFHVLPSGCGQSVQVGLLRLLCDTLWEVVCGGNFSDGKTACVCISQVSGWWEMLFIEMRT